MAAWFYIFISISIAVLLKLIFNCLTQTGKTPQNLPPGPRPLPIIGNLLLFRKSFNDLHCILRSLHAKFGPIITLHFGSGPAIFIADRFLTHQALVENGAIFADRPPSLDATGQVVITTALYGSTWRVLRRNLIAEMLNSSRVKSYSNARKVALGRLLKVLHIQSKSGDHPVIQLIEHFRFSIFSLLVFMCFGDNLDEKKIKEISEVERNLLLSYSQVSMVSIWPRLTKILFHKQWKKILELQQKSRDLVVPLILERKKVKQEKLSGGGNQINNKYISSYVDTLLDLQLPEENRKLSNQEILVLCSEFLDGGTDNTATLLQWIMAYLVKYPCMQEKLFKEIKEVMGDDREMVKEDDLQKMPYLKAVILEGLRRHPPLRYLLPHAVIEDTVLNGFSVPKEGTVNFMIGDMGLDQKVWQDPMAFKPERFLNTDNKDGEGFDITGSKEIKMIPFGAGRRICPGYALAILHLEYFVANLVWHFEWKAVDGDDINMEEKHEFSVRMKYPLKALISPRF